MPITKKASDQLVNNACAVATVAAAKKATAKKKKATAKAVAPAGANAPAVPADELIKKLDEFLSLPAYTDQQYPVIRVAGLQKVQQLRKELQTRRLQALAGGQAPLKFIKVLDKNPPVKNPPVKKVVSGPKPPAPNLP